MVPWAGARHGGNRGAGRRRACLLHNDDGLGDRRGSAAYIVLTKYINNNDIVARCVRIHIHNPIDGNHYGLGYYPFTCDLLVLKY